MRHLFLFVLGTSASAGLLSLRPQTEASDLLSIDEPAPVHLAKVLLTLANDILDEGLLPQHVCRTGQCAEAAAVTGSTDGILRGYIVPGVRNAVEALDIPDIVTGIGTRVGRLGGALLSPVLAATDLRSSEAAGVRGARPTSPLMGLVSTAVVEELSILLATAERATNANKRPVTVSSFEPDAFAHALNLDVAHATQLATLFSNMAKSTTAPQDALKTFRANLRNNDPAAQALASVRLVISDTSVPSTEGRAAIRAFLTMAALSLNPEFDAYTDGDIATLAKLLQAQRRPHSGHRFPASFLYQISDFYR